MSRNVDVSELNKVSGIDINISKMLAYPKYKNFRISHRDFRVSKDVYAGQYFDNIKDAMGTSWEVEEDANMLNKDAKGVVIGRLSLTEQQGEKENSSERAVLKFTGMSDKDIDEKIESQSNMSEQLKDIRTVSKLLKFIKNNKDYMLDACVLPVNEIVFIAADGSNADIILREEGYKPLGHIDVLSYGRVDNVYHISLKD